ncbi:MAG TPA: GvpL/GvpF family gas vesicle protein [Nocardioidaceae bacterium]|nr:GvpL/GvpF family gas vesicle protein [Nocardioidaceae bacterium]
MFVVYAVVRAGDPPPEGIGVGGEPLEVITHDGIGLLVGECLHRPEPSRENLLAFGRVVHQMFAHGPVLPVRFGTTMPNRAAVRTQLAEKAVDWEQRLQAVTDHVEVVVHVRPDRPPSPARSGRAYLLSRAAALRSEHELAVAVTAAASPTACDVRPLPSKDGVRVACLVATDDVDDLRAGLEKWAASADRDLATTGPWPPFSFTESEAETW